MYLRFNKAITIFLLCLMVCGCDEIKTQDHSKESQHTKREVCKDREIRVELADNLLEFNREQVEVWVNNPDEAGRYIDVTKDCSVRFVKNPYSVSLKYEFFKHVPIRVGLSLPNTSNSGYFYSHLDDKTYQEILEKYNDIVVERDDGMLQIWFEDERGNERGYYILTQTHRYEINADPIVFICKRGCAAKYVHPSGIEIKFTRGGYFKKLDVLRVLEDVHVQFENFFIVQNAANQGEE